MVAVEQAPMMSVADDILADRLAAEIKKLIGGRSVADALVLLMAINEALADREVEADPVVLH